MGYTRLAAGAHYLTDVAAAAIIGYTAFVSVRFIYIKVSAKI
jgi:membrane-associated phospholipid phosphatase